MQQLRLVGFSYYLQPWEPTTFIFGGYNPYIGGVKPSNFMVLGSKGRFYTAKRAKKSSGKLYDVCSTMFERMDFRAHDFETHAYFPKCREQCHWLEKVEFVFSFGFSFVKFWLSPPDMFRIFCLDVCDLGSCLDTPSKLTAGTQKSMFL